MGIAVNSGVYSLGICKQDFFDIDDAGIVSDLAMEKITSSEELLPVFLKLFKWVFAKEALYPNDGVLSKIDLKIDLVDGNVLVAELVDIANDELILKIIDKITHVHVNNVSSIIIVNEYH